ncbi:MAG: hypothetical protein RLZZ571_639 [Actinomycetota bacterium]
MTRLILDSTPPESASQVALDQDQQKVVNHRQGALRVLAGPGTGKTTTLVEAMAARLTGQDALSPDQVLGLTFGRRAALDWRDRVTAKVGGGQVPAISTFHSFCYALVRQFQSAEDYLSPFRLLSGPEQEARSRQLFSNSIADGNLTWPQELMPAVGTRGLAEEVRAVMSRTRSHMMEPSDLVKLGKQSDKDTWQAIGKFMDEYLDVLDSEGVLDYSELIYRAVLLSHKPEVQKFLHNRFKAIFVDEYQDTDPGQVSLLKAMVGPETSLVVVGDVDQAIYGFRGADEAGIRNFKTEFSPLFNGKFEDVVLKNCRRFGSTIRSAASIVIGDRIPVGFERVDILAHRNPNVDQKLQDELLIHTFDSTGAEAANIADQIARSHAHDGFTWSDIAVIVRSAKVSLPTIHRALVSAGIPVTVAADEIPLHLDPAVSPLLDVLKAIDNPKAITAELAHDLLTGPLANVDQVDLRRLAATLRREQRKANETVWPSSQLIASAVAKPGTIAHVESAELSQVVQSVSELGNLIESARSKMRKGATPHELLDFVWQQSKWKDRLEQKALSFEFSSHAANRDLDAICALFDLANRFVARGGGKDLTIFLNEIESQVIPAESLAENDTRSDSVRLLTAHRAKGLQWPMVIVAGVQEDLWPDLRSRQTILQADRIGAHEVLMPPTFSETMASERRLFYVAITRAMQKLIVTAVDTTLNDENGTAPSRFLLELKDKSTLIDWHHIGGRPKRPLSAEGIIANLRQVLLSDDTSPALKQAAAFRLAELSKRNVGLFKHANPKNWWGINEITQNRIPNYLSLSPSTIGDIEKCSLRYFLERQAGAVSDNAANLVFGNILHLIAEGLANGHIDSAIEAIDQKIDHIWPDDAYGAKWESDGERREAHIASIRLLNWFTEHSDVKTLTEVTLNAKTKVVDPDGNEFTISINGKADRIEFELDGITIYDFKTSKSIVSKKELAVNVQLALYSYLLENGKFTDGQQERSLEEGQKVSGAALVQLRAGQEDKPTVQELKAGAHDENSEVPLVDRINNAALRIVGNQFEATYEENNCRTCKVKILCPIQPEGRKVQL